MTAASNRQWLQAAACRDQPTRRFTQPDGPDDLAAAQAVCARCPVRRPCLSTALAQPAVADIGIWAGTTPRRPLPDPRRPAARQSGPADRRRPTPSGRAGGSLGGT